MRVGSGSGSEEVVFKSQLVDGNSPTPYTDATTVGVVLSRLLGEGGGGLVFIQSCILDELT